MPSPIVHQGATIHCAHGGVAIPASVSSRVTILGKPIVTVDDLYVVSGCPFVPPAGNGPCISANWVKGATRVMSLGKPVALRDGKSICVPTGTPLLITATQTRVTAT